MGLVFGGSAETIWWKGADGAYLNDAANWDGDAPFSGISPNDMGFKSDTPSRDYTVRLSDDLVCAGHWQYEASPARITYDLGGHTLTFQTQYADWKHKDVTNVIMNGTIAYTNAAGTVLGVNVWNGNNPGYTLLVEGTGRFIGNLAFSDSASKYLTVRDGGYYRGSFAAYGVGSRAVFTGAGTVADMNGGEFTVGGAGPNASALIADGAAVGNVGYLSVGGRYHVVEGDGARLCVSNAALALAGSEIVRLGTKQNRDPWNVSNGNEIRVVDGACVDLKGSPFYIGEDGGSCSNLLYVAGSETVFTNTANDDFPLIAGQGGDWNRVHITDGARATVGCISSGGQNKSFGASAVTSRWNRVTVDGGATLEGTRFCVGTRHADDLKNGRYIGSVTVSNVFVFTDGGTGRVEAIQVGMLPGARDNRFVVSNATVSLTGSERWVNIGFDGAAGNGLEVLRAGVLENVKSLRIGSEVHYQGTEDMSAPASNNYVRIERTSFSADTVEVGNYPNGANRLWVGDGADVAVGGVCLRGFGQEGVVSNGTLRIGRPGDEVAGHGLRPAYTPSEAHTADDSGRQRFSFHGAARMVCAVPRGNDFTNACSFVFHVPVGGYAEAAFESTSSPISFSDDTEFSFDFSALGTDGVQKMPLVRYSGENADARIVMSDALLAKVQEAAEAARPHSRVTLSSDRRLLSLRVPSTRGTLITIR